MEVAAAGELAASLPAEVLHDIFARLPLDARLCAAGVCRAWRAAAADARLYATVDLSPRTGGLARPANDSLLRIVSARAVAALTTLDVRGCEALTFRALIATVRQHAATLATLRTGKLRVGVVPFNANPYDAVEGENRDMPQPDPQRAMPIDAFRLEALLRAGAPALRCCDAAVMTATLAEATRMLASEAPFGVLRVRGLHALQGDAHADGDWPAFTAALAARSAHVRTLCVVGKWMREPGALDALVDASSGLRELHCRFREDYAPPGAALVPSPLAALTRLLREAGRLEAASMERFAVEFAPERVPAAADVEALCDALRDSGSLTALTLRQSGIWAVPDAAASLLAALVGHPRLRCLTLEDTHALLGWPRGLQPGAARALLAMAACRAPGGAALRELHVALAGSRLRLPAGSVEGRVFHALRRNPALVRLSMCGMTHVAARAAAQEEERRKRHEESERRKAGRAAAAATVDAAGAAQQHSPPAAMPGDSDDGSCAMCMDAQRDTALVPCGHVLLCASCAAHVLATAAPACPVCRVPATAARAA
jgi:hypothetical protein